jgi:hypothetical protein
MAEPQSPQNHFSQPPSGFHARSRSSPWITRNEPGSARPFADAAVPVRRWQRLQWQYEADTSGEVSS